MVAFQPLGQEPSQIGEVPNHRHILASAGAAIENNTAPTSPARAHFEVTFDIPRSLSFAPRMTVLVGLMDCAPVDKILAGWRCSDRMVLPAYAVATAGLHAMVSVGEIRLQMWVKMRFQLSQ